MAKYKVKGTDILHNKKLYLEGSEIELDDKNAEQLRDYLLPVKENKVNTSKNNDKTTKTTPNSTKTTSDTNKITSETTPEVKPEETQETNKEAK